MTLTINANNILDEMMAHMDEYENQRREQRKQYPHGQYITNDTPFGDLQPYFYKEKAEKAMYTIHWIFRDTDIYAAASTARKWYKKTKWQRCLSEETAERLIKYYSN